MNLIELVVRDLDALGDDVDRILEAFPDISGVNIPDILRMPIRSYDAAQVLLKKGVFVVPHIRCIDHPLEDSVEIIARLVDAGLSHVLLISGDVPTVLQPTYSVTPVQLTRALKERFPDLTVYCALDPYRKSFQDELQYCRRKLEAGADGFFTQPFFDLRLAELYLDLIGDDTPLFLGASPVSTEKSYQYWVTKNKAVFPKDFEISLGHSMQIARDLVDLATRHSQHTYHMPIRLSGFEYLSELYR